MELKKLPQANLEGNKVTYFLCGLVLILAILLVAFEWSTKNVVKYSDNALRDIDFEEELIPQTQQPEPLPPPPPPPAPKVIQELKIVEDTKEVEETKVESSEDDQEKAQEIISMEEEEEEVIFTIVEEMPKFPGGDAELIKYIATSIEYPVVAAENGIQGRVVCSFVIDKEGKVRDVQVVRSIDPSLDKEAMRVLIAMPQWSPGKQRGKPVKVKYMVPVNFRLQ